MITLMVVILLGYLQEGKGNYTSRKETMSRWSNETYTVKEIDRDVSLNNYYRLDGLTKRYSRHGNVLAN